MKSFPPLRLGRFVAQLQELNGVQAGEILCMDADMAEAEASAILKNALKDVSSKDESLDNPQNWTVQERAIGLASYLSATSDISDVPLGNLKLSNYMCDKPIPKEPTFELGLVADDIWHIQHLTGAMAEAIERLPKLVAQKGRSRFILGGMAAQLFRMDDEAGPSPVFEPVEYDEWLENRVKIISSYPESALIDLIALYFKGLEQLEHYVSIDFDEFGIVFKCTNPPAEEKGGGDVVYSPARFQPLSVFSDITLSFFGKPNR